ncbi:MAG TPA: hypothetical protein VMT30_08235 [Candidatus Saccharimonadia bacterium]|nr:hypothetical protein [Candidatus Saccharimonadia bacterium]
MDPAPTALKPIEDLPRILGFEEDETLRHVREQTVAAIRTGRTATIHEAWRRYFEASDPRVEAPDAHETNRARTGRIIAQALMYREAGEPVEYLIQLMYADYAASSRGWDDVQPELDAALEDRTAEYHQARGKFHAAFAGATDDPAVWYESAIRPYTEAEHASDPSDPRVQGLLSLRLAECYLALLELGQDSAETLQHGIFSSLQTAAQYLGPEPEVAKVTSLMDELSPQPWWQSLVAGS